MNVMKQKIMESNGVIPIIRANPIKKDVLSASQSSLSSPKSKDEVLSMLLKAVVTVDFQAVARLRRVAVDQGLRQVHYKVYTVLELMKLVKKNNWGLCRKHGMTYLYNAAYWIMLEHDDMKAFLGDVADKMGVPHIMAHDIDFRERLLKQFESSAHLQVQEPDGNKTLINLQNGTFEVHPDGFGLRGFSADDFMTYQLPFANDPEATAPIFMNYLNEVLPDKESQRLLAESCAYVFTNMNLEKALFLYGTGANGKSVFYNVLTGLLGPDNCCSYSLSSLTSSANGYSRAMLQNKLVNYASEISGQIDEGLFKQRASCEALEARHPYGRPFSITNYAKMIFNGNKLPITKEHTEAFYRRFNIIPFTQTIQPDKQDKELAHKIIATELPGVFNWILEGLSRLIKQKDFSPCAASEAMLTQYKLESDSVAMFMNEKGYKHTLDKSFMLSELYREYVTFCHEDGYRPVGKNGFSKRLIAAKFHVVRKNNGMIVYAALTPTEPLAAKKEGE